MTTAYERVMTYPHVHYQGGGYGTRFDHMDKHEKAVWSGDVNAIWVARNRDQQEKEARIRKNLRLVNP